MLFVRARIYRDGKATDAKKHLNGKGEHPRNNSLVLDEVGLERDPVCSSGGGSIPSLATIVSKD